MATHSSILAWRIPWTEEPSGLQSMGLQRIRYNWTCTHDNNKNNWSQLWGSMRIFPFKHHSTHTWAFSSDVNAPCGFLVCFYLFKDGMLWTCATDFLKITKWQFLIITLTAFHLFGLGTACGEHSEFQFCCLLMIPPRSVPSADLISLCVLSSSKPLIKAEDV